MERDKQKSAQFLNADFCNENQGLIKEKEKTFTRKKAENFRVARLPHFIKFESYFYFDVNLLNLQM